MYDRVMREMRRAARAGRLRLTDHAADEIEAEGFTFDDVVNCILTGEVVKVQFDADRRENKYVWYGEAADEREMGLVAKFDHHQRTVVITVFWLTIEDYD